MAPVTFVHGQEEFFIELHAARRLCLNFHHPTFDAVRIELPVPGAIEAISELDPFAVAAHLHHLRPTVQRSGSGMGGAIHNAVYTNRASKLRIERLRDIVLAELT